MPTYSQGPRLLKGAIVAIDPTTSGRSTIVFQYNPETVKRSLEPQLAGGEGGQRSLAVRYTGAPVETFDLEAAIVAADQLTGKEHSMSTKAQVKTQAKTPGAPGQAHVGQPPVAVPEREAELPDIAAQLEGAARLGHSLGAISVRSAAPSQIQAKPLIQRQELPEEEEEEELQLKPEPAAIQRQELPEEEEEELQMKPEIAALQRQGPSEEEEELMMQPDIPRVGLHGGPIAPGVEAAAQRATGDGASGVRQENRTGLPDKLKAGLEDLSGLAMDDVRVHYNSSKPAEINAHAFTQSKDIHIASGRETHLPHEGWHVVQQAQGRVKPTMQLKDGVPVNDDQGLEHEADVMGARAARGEAAHTGEKSANDRVSPKQARSNDMQFSCVSDSPRRALGHASSTGGRVIQRVRGLAKDSYVEVRDGPVPWYGQIDSVSKTGYNVRVGGTDRVVPVPFEQAAVHPGFKATASQIAQEIIESAPRVPQAGTIGTQVKTWASTYSTPHDPMETLKFMMSCNALSTNRRVSDMLRKEQNEAVKEVVKELEKLFRARQIIQEWSFNPADDIAKRGDAWKIFCQGVSELEGRQEQLNEYLANCLAHDKGYAQIYEAAANYLLYSPQSSVVVKESFEDVLGRALTQDSNTNIWDGGQLGCGKLEKQLKREVVTTRMATSSESEQEEMMWSRVVTEIIVAKDPVQKDWTYRKTIMDNQGALFDNVRELVPKNFPLTKEKLKKVLEW